MQKSSKFSSYLLSCSVKMQIFMLDEDGNMHPAPFEGA